MVVEPMEALLIIMLHHLVVQVVAVVDIVMELQEELETEKQVLPIQLQHKEIMVVLQTTLLNMQDQVVVEQVVLVEPDQGPTLVMVVLVFNSPQHLETLRLNLQVERVVV